MSRFEKTMWKRLDFVAMPLAVLYAGLTRLFYSRQKHWPRSRALMRNMGAYAGSYHYYMPGVRETDLYRDLDQPRTLLGIDLKREQQIERLKWFRFADEFAQFPKSAKTGTSYHLSSAFPPPDGEVLYTFIRHLKPKRIVEIGSGNSTLLMLAAIARNRKDDPNISCDLRCVEPFAHPWLENTGVRIERSRVERLGLEYFEDLEDGDFLFIDSSHVVRAQNDVVFLYLELLPRLKPGVFVHIHDIFSPRDYPREWLIENNRQWAEQYLMEAFLQFNPTYEVFLAVNDLAHAAPEAFYTACPMAKSMNWAKGGSFWLRRI
ncbi:MAG: hypothetical protein B7Y80_12995 [Hyphomicrobium sp. 32-62-53]|nr:MAG: hypothetical protein B7Z29_13230 [Hyphomicrobium sp. 12-62-95]OYX98952.1 MAG: hypothetical protein B7Y80_12995 [Hyphomicrobium sp. 32-62-53]